MNFLSPLFLWGLPLVAAPLIIHLFSRKQRDVIRWAAMEFLLAGATPRRRFLRLKDILLMLIRMALLLAIIAALARPMVSMGWLGSAGPRDVVLVLDNSMSTARKVGKGTVFDQEVDQAAKLIHQLNATDTLRVMLASPAPEWFTDSPQSADAGTQATVISRLRQLAPNQGAADMAKSIQAAMKGKPSDNQMTRFVTVISDGQATAWRPDATTEWASIFTLAQQARPPILLRAIIAGGPGPVSNLAVEKLTASRVVAGVGQSVPLTASIKNTGTVASDSASLAWTAAGQSLGLTTVPPLEPGAATTVTLSQPFPSVGVLDISCRLSRSDDLPMDDSAHFFLDVTQSVPILLVEGEAQSDPLQSDTAYFLAALGWSGQGAAGAKPLAAASIFQPKLINYRRLDSEDLAAYQCVVLANIPRLPDELVQKLARYVNSGGGLWIALGDQTEIAPFNRAFYDSGAGLSPVSLRQPIGDPADRGKFTAVAPPSADHPATALLADTHRLDIDRVRVYRRHQFDIADDKSISVLLRAEGGAGLAVEKTYGRGRVIVQAFPLNLSWSNLPLCHSFVVMVQEWLWYLTEAGLVHRNLQPGEPLQAARPLDVSNGSATVQTPNGDVAQAVGRPEQGRMVFRYARTLIPGEYRLAISGEKQTPEKFLVNRDAAESDLTPLTTAQIASLRDVAGLGFGGEPFSQPRRQRVAAPPKALVWGLLGVLAGLMVLEGILAFSMDRRRQTTAPAVVM